MLIARGLTKWFGTRRAVSDVDLELAEGERVVMLGANGSGKSTLLHLVAGVLSPDAGEVAVRAAIGFAPEKPDVPDHLVVAEWLRLVASLHRSHDDLAALVARARFLELTPLLGRRVAELSLGQRHRVALAAAFVAPSPATLVLDEPTNALDAATREALVVHLTASRLTCLIATHDSDFAARVATRAVRIEAGRVAPGPTLAHPSYG